MGAPLNPVPNVLKIVIGQLAGGRPVDNILHWQYSGTPPSNATCAAFGTAIAGSWQTHIASLQISTTVLQDIQVTDLTSPTAGEGTTTAGSPGTRGDDELPGNAAVLISYPIQARYKGGHPRTYLMAGGFADLASTVDWTALFAQEVHDHWGPFVAGITGTANSGCVLAEQVAVRYRGKFLPNGGPPHYYLTNPIVLPIVPGNFLVQQQIASQRRRIGRVRK